ncbi:MAG: pullulanase [Succinivibrio sp.]|jgi:hypothetical protein|nr:pullulanase [Succinivibrio sp.]
MKKAKYLCLAVFAAAALAGCSSTSDSEGALPELYLRGTMNDYGVKPEFLLKQTGDEGLCADAKLSAGDGYTKFKFADAGWTPGANYGYADTGLYEEGGAPLKLNPNSKFEDLSFQPKEDGVYRFCMVKQGKDYYAVVKAVK